MNLRRLADLGKGGSHAVDESLFLADLHKVDGASPESGKNLPVMSPVMMVAAAEAAVGLAIIIAVFRARATLAVDRIDLMKL